MYIESQRLQIFITAGFHWTTTEGIFSPNIYRTLTDLDRNLFHHLTSSISGVTELIMEMKDKIEKGLEIIGLTFECLAGAVGQICPMLEAVFKVVGMVFDTPGGKEDKFLDQQFQKVKQKLENVEGEIKKTELVIQRASLNTQYIKFYANIISQYEYFKYIFTLNPDNKKLNIEEFLIHFGIFEGYKNLEELYDAIMKENASGQTLLDTIVSTEQRSRRAVEEFCKALMKLFVIGYISLISYATLKKDPLKEEMMKTWLTRMEEVEKRMKAAVDECVNNFVEQAKSEINEMFEKDQSSIDPEFLLDALKEKYYWVSWSVRVFNDDGKTGKLLFGKQSHIDGVQNYFEYLRNDKIKVVVSFTADPKPLNKKQIKDEIEKEKGGVESVAESLSKSFPNCLVHAISRSDTAKEANNFEPEHFYYIHHNIGNICIHSE